MNQYEVVETVRQIVERDRRWIVQAISEQDAIRLVRERAAARGYRGESRRLVAAEAPQWAVNGVATPFRPAEAVPVDDGTADIGGGD
jgi:hypothetical protein